MLAGFRDKFFNFFKARKFFLARFRHIQDIQSPLLLRFRAASLPAILSNEVLTKLEVRRRRRVFSP